MRRRWTRRVDVRERVGFDIVHTLAIEYLIISGGKSDAKLWHGANAMDRSAIRLCREADAKRRSILQLHGTLLTPTVSGSLTACSYYQDD